ncbi:hypothetical protein V1477_001951 [Vespula maculifrons]|uniref:Uncharacterized protein n=2 Tax=Vespula TaxID=7451 RepID=A0A834KR49_VESVU|nr:hypothetical protein HZH66_000218 [Vespula vulgaris]
MPPDILSALVTFIATSNATRESHTTANPPSYRTSPILPQATDKPRRYKVPKSADSTRPPLLCVLVIDAKRSSRYANPSFDLSLGYSDDTKLITSPCRSTFREHLS